MWNGKTQTVEESIAFVREKFADMCNDLVLVDKKLVSELGGIYGAEIFTLHEKCQETERKIRKMVRSLEELYEERKKLMATIDAQLKMSASLKNIEKMLGSHIPYNENTHLLELLALHYKAIWNDAGGEPLPQEEAQSDHVVSPSVCNSSSVGKHPIIIEEQTQEIVFKPISQKQFEDIPPLVKRRAKLEQINELYKFLFDMAIARNKCLPVKLKEISQRGIQVFGQTGSSKLASLRYLKVVEISNRDETATLVDERIGLCHVKNKRKYRK